MLLLTKAIVAIMIGFLSSALLGLILVPLLKKLRVGQKISIFVGDAHRKKEGTPTMGGLIFVIPTLITVLALLITNKMEHSVNLLIILFTYLKYNKKKTSNEVLNEHIFWFFIYIRIIFFFYIFFY